MKSLKISLILLMLLIASCKENSEQTEKGNEQNTELSLVSDFDGISFYDQLTDSTIRLNWISHADAIRYDIYVITNSVSSFLQSVTAPTDNITLTGLNPDTRYTFRVLAVDKNNNSSHIINDKTFSSLAEPKKPSSLSLISSANLNSPIIRVDGVKSGDSVKIFSDPNCINQVGAGISNGASIDISTNQLAVGEYTFYANSTNLLNKPSICSSAMVSYIVNQCPVGYISVPSNSDLGVGVFCVMKYEAKNLLGSPVSQTQGLPWDSLSPLQAKAACTGLGLKYDLISNSEWMTIARNAENVASNWSRGVVGQGMLPIGHSDLDPQNYLSVNNITNPYDQTNNSSSQPWDNEDFFRFRGGEQRRTINLSNGEIIWDMAGNAAEWVDWSINPGYQASSTTCTSNSNDSVEISEVSCPGITLADYSPANQTLNSRNGIGKFFFSAVEGKNAIIRGGDWRNVESARPAGIFNLQIWGSINFGGSEGFRCVYRP